MNRWGRCGDEGMIGVLSGGEAELLRSHADGLVLLAERWLARCRWVDGSTRGSGRLVAGEPVDDERITAIVREHVPAGAADWEISWWAPVHLAETAEAARRVLRTLPESGGVVLLETARDVDAWCRLIGDVLAALHPCGDCCEDGHTSAQTWLESLLGPLLVGVTAL
ncbi:hypothetical protein [Lentzea albida]|uniref:Uncharacterized protein n=1 Tax=Lentzea albida TaxID=65499 RepID=A0A1H9PWU5_9PSEU|nr:hypothetical protein [Lentzea albida]SER52073.1 hypothetical protein SAMN04488000_109274 [Lentzea albida]